MKLKLDLSQGSVMAAMGPSHDYHYGLFRNGSLYAKAAVYYLIGSPHCSHTVPYIGQNTCMYIWLGHGFLLNDTCDKFSRQTYVPAS